MRKMRVDIILAILFLASTTVQSVSGHSEWSNPEGVIPEDSYLNFTQLALKYGHKCDEHDIFTADGYILKLFNVRGDKTRPVFMQHGFTDSSDTFIIRGNTSLVITLADQGYDVWVGNSRGNHHGRRHLNLDPNKDKAFWNFSQHEMGVYDLPAMIDYVLNETKQTLLSAIGHSQGTMIFYILTAEKTEYNDKIKLFISLAPVCYLHHMKPLLSTAVDIWPWLKPWLGLAGIVEVFSRNSLIINFIKKLCVWPIKGYAICSFAIFAFAGFDTKELEGDFIPILFGHYPNSVSVKNGNHLAQIAQNKRFSKYDYGVQGNLERYGTPEPPNYDLEKVRIPVALLASLNDNISDLQDVDLLRRQLGNVVHYQVMERPQYNHIDHVWGKHMTTYLFPILLDLLEKYHSKNNTVET